jgi:[ribosomal protein S18]-alanine N-acetyltransferase
MTLRAMRWWDIPELVALEEELFPDQPWSDVAFWSELAHVPATRWYMVHEDADGIDGYVGLMAVPPEADVQTIAVATRAQGNGLGRELLSALIDEARRRECSQVFLEVRSNNASAVTLYESVGFERQAVRTDYYGPGRDAVVMRLRLRNEEVAS